MKTIKKLQLLFLFLAAFFIYRFLAANLDSIDLRLYRLEPTSLIMAALASLASFHFLANKLSALYETELPKMKFSHLFKTMAKTNLYRYLPGGVWNHAGLAVEASLESGKSLKTTAKLQFLNIAFMVYTGAIFCFFVLPYPYNWLFLLFFAASILLINRGFSFVNHFLLRFGFKQKIHFTTYPPRLLTNILFNNLFFWLFNGLAFVYFLESLGIVGHLQFSQLLYLSASYILAWLAGFLFLPAPAGVGVREAVLMYFLSQAGVSLAVGISVSLLHRLFILVRDLLVFTAIPFVRD
jgi:hypothetical protein